MARRNKIKDVVFGWSGSFISRKNGVKGGDQAGSQRADIAGRAGEVVLLNVLETFVLRKLDFTEKIAFENSLRNTA